MDSVTIGSSRDTAEKVFRILQVEDNVAYARLVSSLLRKFHRYHFDLLQVMSLKAALTAVRERVFDVVLLDLELPDSQGLATLERMCHSVPELPVVLLTCTRQEAVSLQAVQYGAQDYLVKGEFDADLLIRVICYAIDRKQAEIDLTRLAQYDPLTGLANRQLFVDRLEQAMIRSRRGRGVLGLLYLDLDHFKSVNDSLGHDVGDMLLEQTAERIQKNVRAQDTVARLGGDEFTVILENVGNRKAVAGIAEKIIAALSQPFLLREHEVFAATSVGAALFGHHSDAIEAKRLIKQADIAMYRAKQHAGNTLLFFDDNMDVDTRARVSMEKALRSAMLKDEFVVEYQPQIDVCSGSIIGAEALLHWRNAEFGDRPIEEIIGVLEQVGLIGPVGEWILDTACNDWQSWRRCGYVAADAGISVNLSPRQFWQHDMADVVRKALQRSTLPAELLNLELTETLLLKNTDRNVQTLQTLNRLGVGITIDDFGAGFGSLGYLKHFPISKIKIDRTLVREILSSEQDRAIVLAVIELAHNLKLKVIAEGVDSWEKVRLLHAQGCRYFQGHRFSPPLPAQQFVQRCRMPVTVPPALREDTGTAAGNTAN